MTSSACDGSREPCQRLRIHLRRLRGDDAGAQPGTPDVPSGQRVRSSVRELAVLTGMEGTMLIDATAGRPVRVDATLIRDVTFGERTRGTTVFVRQRHSAHDARILASYPPAEVTIDAIADLLDIDLPTLARGAITV